MMSSSVTMEQMPVRLLALAVGALLIVLLNLLVHRSKHYDTKEELVNSLLDDLMLVIDAKLNNEEYESTIPKINDNVSSTVFENLGYRYLNNYRRESLTTICKTADGILNLINTGNLTDEELNRIKTEIIHVKNNEKIFRKQNESKVLSVILLNLEIIESQMDDMEVDVENTYDLSVVTSFIKNSLSFSSFGVSFAIKLASLISFWELLGMLFDLPYVKWLYFSSLALLIPYADDASEKSKIRIIATVIGVILFVVVLMALFSDYSIFNLLNINVSSSLISVVFILLLVLLLLLFFKDQLRRTIITTLLSLMMALKYINLVMAISLKLLWLFVAVIVAYVLTMYVMPYSIRKETIKTLNICEKINDKLVDLLKNQSKQEETLSKAGLIVSSNVINGHISSNNITLQDSTIKELNVVQKSIAVLCDFLLNNIQIGKLNQKSKESIYNILSLKEVDVTEDMCYEEKLSIYTTKHILNLKQEEEQLLSNLNKEELG
ncbi:MAG: hypothetical protein BZ135_05715 [Methanosphaera sp. rholeuAM6]|nr:MAG: hypothetical protein BZ135_05715 [Methanosphaera sp. rholeuAM6]